MTSGDPTSPGDTLAEPGARADAMPDAMPDAWAAREPVADARASRRPASRAALGACAGLVAAAVTAGALVGFGRSDGGAMLPFAALGRLVLGDPVVRDSGEALAVAGTGLVVHVLLVTALGAAFGLVAAGARGLRLAALAVATSLLAAVLHLVIASVVLRSGNAVSVFPLQGARLVALYLMLAAGLGCGMRVALLCLRLDERSS